MYLSELSVRKLLFNKWKWSVGWQQYKQHHDRLFHSDRLLLLSISFVTNHSSFLHTTADPGNHESWRHFWQFIILSWYNINNIMNVENELFSAHVHLHCTQVLVDISNLTCGNDQFIPNEPQKYHFNVCYTMVIWDFARAIEFTMNYKKA